MSALSDDEIRFPERFFGSAAHDVIARSAGIGGDTDNFSDRQPLNADNIRALEKGGPRAFKAAARSQEVLRQNRDL